MVASIVKLSFDKLRGWDDDMNWRSQHFTNYYFSGFYL